MANPEVMTIHLAVASPPARTERDTVKRHLGQVVNLPQIQDGVTQIAAVKISIVGGNPAKVPHLLVGLLQAKIHEVGQLPLDFQVRARMRQLEFPWATETQQLRVGNEWRMERACGGLFCRFKHDQGRARRIELELNPMVPVAERGAFSLRLILHGRRVCHARRPACGECVLADICPSRQI